MMTQEKFTFPRHGMDKDTTIGTSLEEAISKVSRCTDEIEPLDGFTVNPTVEIIGGEGELDFFLVFRHPETNEIEARRATPEELIALKVISGDLDPVEASEEAGCKPAVIDRAIWSAVESGVILAPRPRLVREPFTYPEGAYTEGLLATRVFSLQWHITQVCDLHCKHCYDRSDRVALTLERAQFVLEDLGSFCHKSGVRGHVCFSGGNPFLHPDFVEIYRLASDMGFMTSILGNPVPRHWVEEIIEIQMPNYYQVSLEGLAATNDSIRGEGHFDRTLKFLALLNELGVDSSVMLTLTSMNIHEVLPLGRVLDDYTESFTFNRLSAVGEGARLALPSKAEFLGFLSKYVESYHEIRCLYYKDNLFNPILYERGEEPFDGCTGFGCGAAFNFVALLSDGEVHACRKFPSLLGNIFEGGLEEIYFSNLARRFRSRPLECRSCVLSPSCGGCLASSMTFNRDIFKERDPFCPFGDKD